jgi:PAS domain S-box-containing protein
MEENQKTALMKHKTVYDDLTFYHFVINSIPVGVITVDSELRITSFNHWAEKLTGYTAKETLGRFCGDVLHGGKCGTECPLKTILSLQNPVLRLESTIENKLGKTLPVRMNTAALLDHEGRLLGGVEAFQDISYLKALEREKEGFISMIAHDMKSSLTIIGGFALRLFQKGSRLDGEKGEKYLSIIKDETEKVETLVQDFLEFSRIQTGRLKLNLGPTSVDALLMDLHQVYEPKAADLGISLRLEKSDDLSTIEGDARQLRRVFTNLLDNALKFSDKPGSITVSSRQGEESNVVVTVKDEGRGIPPEELPLIFDAFHRGKAGEKIKGFGLGLASVKAIVEAHGGRVLVESEPGKGSTFNVVLPLSSIQQPLIKHGASAPA